MAENMSPEEIAALLKRVGKWREDLTRKQLMALEDAGLMSLRAWGQGLPDFDAIDPIDGEPVPQTMDEAFALLRRLADRSNLSPMGVLHALTAGMLAGGQLVDAFPAIHAHWREDESPVPVPDAAAECGQTGARSAGREGVNAHLAIAGVTDGHTVGDSQDAAVLADIKDSPHGSDFSKLRRELFFHQARALQLRALVVGDPLLSARLEAESSLAFLRATQGECPRVSLSGHPEAASDIS